ncbi:histone acetyltransferase [Geranomyces variabilis]|nr:histone acetyltransferase [Geranomyces variabilis]
MAVKQSSNSRIDLPTPSDGIESTSKRALSENGDEALSAKRRRKDSTDKLIHLHHPTISTAAPQMSFSVGAGASEDGQAARSANGPLSGRTLADQTLGSHVEVGLDQALEDRLAKAAPAILTGNLVAPPDLSEGPGSQLVSASPNTPTGPDNFPEVRSAKYKRIFEDERAGRVSFRLAHNDGTHTNLSLLSKLKAVIQTQLPKMPREYIARVVYSREHYSYVVVRDSGEVVGGICFRPFIPRKFAEIVFLAVLSMSQTAGYGARLIAHFKDYVRSAFDTQHLLTYADNLAIGFFKKQGFTSEISLEKSIWVGYIKDYEGATLLQCSFLPKVNYLEIYSIYASHRKSVFKKIKEASLSHVVYPGLDVFKQGATKVEPTDIPGLKDSGWTSAMEEKPVGSTEGRGPLYQMLTQLLLELREDSSAWAFREPVSGVADYYLIIKNPMDLATMEGHLKDGKYETYEAFEADFALIIQNAKMYNDETTAYYKAACRLERSFRERSRKLMMDFGLSQVPH